MNERFHRPVNTNLCETVWFNYYLQNLQILLDLSLPSCPLTHNPVCDVMMCSHKSVESVLWSAGAKIQKKKKNIYWLKLTVHKKLNIETLWRKSTPLEKILKKHGCLCWVRPRFSQPAAFPVSLDNIRRLSWAKNVSVSGRCPLRGGGSSLDGAQGHDTGRLHNVLILYSEADEISQRWRLFAPWCRYKMITNKARQTKTAPKKSQISLALTVDTAILC